MMSPPKITFDVMRPLTGFDFHMRSESKPATKTSAAGFVQSLTRSCSQRRILHITLLLENYDGKKHDNPLLSLKSGRMSK